jgi:hypothetical protein
MFKDYKIYKLIERLTASLRENGIVNNGYLMLREPQTLRLIPQAGSFDVSIAAQVWEKGVERDRAVRLILSMLGCNLANGEASSPVGVRTTVNPSSEYKRWKQNFRRCYNDLNALKSSSSSKANSCVYPIAHPLLNHKPCVIYAQFGIYGNKLQLIVNARATHLFMMYVNFFQYIYLQLLFSSLLEMPLGDFFFITNNFHLLEDQQGTLSIYTNLRSESQTSLCPSPLTIRDYNRDRKYILLGKQDRITWNIFRNLIDQIE